MVCGICWKFTALTRFGAPLHDLGVDDLPVPGILTTVTKRCLDTDYGIHFVYTNWRIENDENTYKTRQQLGVGD